MLFRIRGRERRGYCCGEPFGPGELPVLDNLDRPWHLICFVRDSPTRQDPFIPRELRGGLVLPGTKMIRARRPS